MMINRQTEKRLCNLVVWFMALVVLAILTGCNPYAGLPDATPTPTTTRIATSTAVKTVTVSPSPAPLDLLGKSCTVRTGVPSGYLNLRTGAGTRYAVIRILAEGATLTVIRRAAWLQVIDPKGTRGYVYSKYCR